jgi:hypothetical protein
MSPVIDHLRALLARDTGCCEGCGVPRPESLPASVRLCDDCGKGAVISRIRGYVRVQGGMRWLVTAVLGVTLLVSGCSGGGGYEGHGVSFDGPGRWDMHDQSPGPAGSQWIVGFRIHSGLVNEGLIYVTAFPQMGLSATNLATISSSMVERAEAMDNGTVTRQPHLIHVGSLNALQMEWTASYHSVIYTVVAGRKAQYQVGCRYGVEDEVGPACAKLIRSFKET